MPTQATLIEEAEDSPPRRESKADDIALLETYIEHMERSFDVYERLRAAGWRKERARGVLGTAVYTEFIWTVNAWSLMNWLNKRHHKSAQWEHRQYAEAVLRIFEKVMPITAGAFVDYVLKRENEE